MSALTLKEVALESLWQPFSRILILYILLDAAGVLVLHLSRSILL